MDRLRVLLSVTLSMGPVSFTAVASGQEGLPTFIEIGRSSGFNLVGHGRGCAWADMDGDGLEDFGIGLMDGGLLHQGGFFFYRNLGDLQFEERRDAVGLHVDETVYGVTFPDVDNDGDSDVFVNCGGYQSAAPVPQKNRLFLNDGHGVFTEVPEAGGLALLGFSFTSAWDDVNGDGLLDVFICRMGVDGNTPDRRFFLNRGNATFEDATVAAGLAAPVDSHQPVFFDMEGDGDPDLALANRDTRVSMEEPPQTPNQLYRNEGNGTFVDVSAASGVSAGRAGFVADVADIDRDGDLDLFMGAYNNLVSGIYVPGAHDCLYRNEGQGKFVEMSEEAGVAVVGGSMGCRFWDFDNDGWPDLQVSKGGAEPNRVETDIVYRNLGDGRFVEAGQEIGIYNRTAGHGATACDADQDGDLDFLLPSGSMLHGTEARSLLYENLGPTGSAVAVRPQGEAGNKDAVGARILLRTGEVRVVGQITAGSGYSSMAPAEAWFGVGSTAVLDEVTVIWRSGVHRTGTDIPVVPRLVPLRPVDFQLLTPEVAPVDPLAGTARVRFRWEDPKPAGHGRYEITIGGSVEGVSLPIVAETETAGFEADLPVGTYTWSVRLLDELGEVSRATPAQAELVVEPSPVTMPILLASPNPFQGAVTLVGLLPPDSPPMEVEIVDATGSRVALLAAGGDGSAQVVWDGRTTRGTIAPPGIYWARVRSSAGVAPVVLVRL